MTKKMKEDYVTFEQAKTLKELGFEWECYKFYYDNGQLEGYVSDGWHGDECRDWNDKFNSAIANAIASAVFPVSRSKAVFKVLAFRLCSPRTSDLSMNSRASAYSPFDAAIQAS